MRSGDGYTAIRYQDVVAALTQSKCRLMYWVVYASFTVIEVFLDVILFFVSVLNRH